MTFSCEIFPPKAGVDMSRMDEIIRDIAALHPDFISVTYGAGGSTSKRTVEIASKIQDTYGIPAMAHLTCVSSTKEEVVTMLDRIEENHIENILALRGDIPQDMDFPSPQHYRYACELIQDIRSQKGDRFCIGGACYPEGHVECEHKEDDIDYLKQKVESGCDFLTTQMFFDNNVFYNFLYRIMAKGIQVPVVAGVMPVTNSRQIKRSCELSGTTLPPRFKAIADTFSDKPLAMKQAGIAYATEQIIDLLSNGVNHIHLYTMNNPEIAAKIMDNLSGILRDEEA
ncbi:methylenetetrahydrofolate reductase [NAD(P)H] [Anaeromassilibacillus senegalensis]|uniref:methylenetetrahydrofolate reductase [NAD(P)H] n=1 Tax=Anaeromassilibacillus senegalensis TaxID=1673717 RepID=UPI003B00B5CB